MLQSQLISWFRTNSLCFWQPSWSKPGPGNILETFLLLKAWKGVKKVAGIELSLSSPLPRKGWVEVLLFSGAADASLSYNPTCLEEGRSAVSLCREPAWPLLAPPQPLPPLRVTNVATLGTRHSSARAGYWLCLSKVSEHNNDRQDSAEF